MDPQKNSTDDDFAFPVRKERVVNPLAPSSSQQSNDTEDNSALTMLRQKLDRVYQTEPNAKEEMKEAKIVKTHRSKHQQFMHELSASGKSLAEIQTAWHNYYINLPNHEKHEVWQEFYANHNKLVSIQQPTQPVQPQSTTPQLHPAPAAAHSIATPHSKMHKATRSVSDIKKQLLGTISARSKQQARKTSHLHSIGFGLAMGLVVLAILLFGFFNERFIAPFITPSRSVSSTPIIIDPNTTAVGPESKIIVPKINVEIPIVYDEPSIDEAAIQRALERGVIHYPTTPIPGETGNGVIFGHSSNNILNRGKYKFAFVLLKRLENGDTFYIQRDGKRYVYKVFDKKVVSPTDISVLGGTAKPSSMTLITCDPPGTSINRLVVIGEQISPDPSLNVASKVKQETASQPQTLPSDAPSLWQRIRGWFTS